MCLLKLRCPGTGGAMDLDLQVNVLAVFQHALATGTSAAVAPEDFVQRFLFGQVLRIGPASGRFGPRKAAQLRAIDETGSISAAARTLGMSYARAWHLTEKLNAVFRERLVETYAGGNRRGGASLSRTGQKVFEIYKLGDAMEGDATFHARQDYAEEAWRIVDAALKAKPPVRAYKPGTWGPKAAGRITPPGGWHNPGSGDESKMKAYS